MDVKGITIHNTNNDLGAKDNLALMRELQNNGVFVSVHYFVDAEEIILATPLDQITYHTGKGYDLGNTNTISIEVCSKGLDDEYKQAEENALFLIRQLMGKFKLSADDIYFHQDFDMGFYCPHRILDKYTKEEWIEKNGLVEYSNYLRQEKLIKERTLRRVG